MKNNQIKTFSNGLRVASDEMNEVETVSIGIFVNVGSRNETIKNNGISHFLEHMAFKGTKKRSAKQIAEEFEGIGGYINAYTSREKTVYYAKVLKEDAEFALEFLSDIIQNSVFDSEEIKKESGVILQELAMTIDTPDDIIYDYFQETAFPNQALGRSIIGLEQNIKNFKKNNFVNYINQNYTANNMAIISAGNLKHQDLIKWSKKYFNKIAPSKTNDDMTSIYKGGDFHHAKKLEQIHYIVGFQGISYTDPNYYKAQILSMILGGGMSSRLFQEIREKKGLAYSIYSFNYCFKDSGLFGIYGGTSPDKINKMIDSIANEINQLTKKILPQEIERVKTQFKASLKMTKESTSSRMQKLGNDIINHNRSVSDKEIIEKFSDLTTKDIVNFAQQIFSSKPTTTSIGDAKKITKIAGLL